MSRHRIAIATLTGGLVAAPAGVALWLGPGPALALLGALLVATSLLIGWDS